MHNCPSPKERCIHSWEGFEKEDSLRTNRDR